jgi:hypothetical protein
VSLSEIKLHEDLRLQIQIQIFIKHNFLSLRCFFYKSTKVLMIFKVLTEASVKMVVFWPFAPCTLVEVYRRFRGACCLNPSGDNSSHWLWSLQAPLKRRKTSTRVQDATSGKSAIFKMFDGVLLHDSFTPNDCSVSRNRRYRLIRVCAVICLQQGLFLIVQDTLDRCQKSNKSIRRVHYHEPDRLYKVSIQYFVIYHSPLV